MRNLLQTCEDLLRLSVLLPVLVSASCVLLSMLLAGSNTAVSDE